MGRLYVPHKLEQRTIRQSIHTCIIQEDKPLNILIRNHSQKKSAHARLKNQSKCEALSTVDYASKFEV